jgi:hypothetical protein
MYLVFSVSASRPTSLLASVKVSVDKINCFQQFSGHCFGTICTFKDAPNVHIFIHAVRFSLDARNRTTYVADFHLSSYSEYEYSNFLKVILETSRV